MSRSVNPRARHRGDRAGNPLDGLVNLFDLGIALAVAFLLAALASLDLSPSALDRASRPAKPVVAERGETVERIELDPGQRVVGHGEPLGTVYRLRDGRTVIVRSRK